jgi:hypothetical protein
METEKGPKGPVGFICEKCDFKCYKKSKYERHLGTAKHKWKQMETFGTKKIYECICGKEYNTRSGLFKHKKKCNYKTPEQIKEQSMWRTLYPSIKKDNGVGHCGRKRSYSI